MNEELAAHDITYRQWVLLACLSLLGREASQSELADRMGIETPTLVGVIDRMERDEWIQRVPDPSDRRKKLTRPTERVEPVWAKMARCALQVRCRAADGLAAEQLDQLRDTLVAIRGNLTGDEADRGTTAKNTGEAEKPSARRHRPTRAHPLDWSIPRGRCAHGPPSRGGQSRDTRVFTRRSRGGYSLAFSCSWFTWRNSSYIFCSAAFRG